MADTVAASLRDGPSSPVMIAAVTLAREGADPLSLTCCTDAQKMAKRMRPSAVCLLRLRTASMRESSGSLAAAACILGALAVDVSICAACFKNWIGWRMQLWPRGLG